MTNLIRAELRKFTTTRTGPALALGTLALGAFIAFGAVGGHDAAGLQVPLDQQPFLFFGGMVRILFVILGIRMVVDEYRYGTVVPAFVASPRRERVLAAKVALGSLIGLVAGALATGATVLSAGIAMSRKGVALELGGALDDILIAGAAAGALWVVIGIGVGAIVRHQVAATVGAVIWIVLLEQVAETTLGRLGDYLPVTASYPLSTVPTTALAVTAAAILTAWAVGLVGIGGRLEARRDITGE